jgi:glycosyltransferase involved in cell wall biosynthesis
VNRPKFSVIVPVFNRPQEVEELLRSLLQQTAKDFEVIIVEDGSQLRCETVVDSFRDNLNVHYIFKPNSGPGPSRNVGYSQAQGEYFVVFDSDCIVPPDYFAAVESSLIKQPLDAWGGPDMAHESFTLLQRAMGYTMSSVLTTGGIRGGKKRMGWFQPRSFNMGISRKVFETTKGFQFDRYAEDIEFSIRMKNAGFRVGLIPEAFVYHKRRTTLGQFYKQVFNFGKGRALIGKRYPEEVKITHWFPAFFMLAVVMLLVTPFISIVLFRLGVIAFCFYLLCIFLHSWIMNRNFLVAVLSVPSALLQFFGYGLGFLQETVKPYPR